MGSQGEEVLRLTYHGTEDLTVWLRKICPEEPHIFPRWIPGTALLSLIPILNGGFELNVVPNLKAAVSILTPDNLWFCGVPIEEVCSQTEVKPEWFVRGVAGNTLITRS